MAKGGAETNPQVAARRQRMPRTMGLQLETIVRGKGKRRIHSETPHDGPTFKALTQRHPRTKLERGFVSSPGAADGDELTGDAEITEDEAGTLRC